MRRLVAALFFLSVAASACSSPGAAPLEIGAIYPLSGPQAPGGREELGGLRAALKVAQDTGVLKRPVHIHVVDVETPDAAAAAVDQLIDRDHVALVTGTYGSTLSAAAAARADQRHTVYWETGAVADAVTQGHSWVFQVVASGAMLGRIAVEFTGRQFGRPRATAAILQVDDVYGDSVAGAEADAARVAGIQVVARIKYDPLGYTPAAIAGQLAAVNPDFLWDVSYIDDGIAIWRALKARGESFVAAVGTSSAFCMAAFGDSLGAQAIGVFAADKPDGTIKPDVLSPSARDLLARATKAYGGELTIPAVAGFVGGWTLFHDVLRGVRDAGSSSIREAALRVDVPLGGEINGGGVRFVAGQNVRAAAVVGQWQASGVMRTVYPAGYATARPI
ncbi:MAG TPA: ABC transporter substrate-binding protein [Candidatus Dormibacteraeota bacterium]